MLLKLFIGTLTVLSLISGCASVDTMMSTRGKLHSSISKYDEIRTVYITPALATTGFGVTTEMGLYWDANKGDIAHLIFQVNSRILFEPSAPLKIKVDGEEIILKPVSSRDYGEFDTNDFEFIGQTINQDQTTKRFYINKEDILKIANGEKTVYRLMEINSTYFDGTIDYTYRNMTSFVPEPFNRFYKEVWGNK